MTTGVISGTATIPVPVDVEKGAHVGGVSHEKEARVGRHMRHKVVHPRELARAWHSTAIPSQCRLCSWFATE